MSGAATVTHSALVDRLGRTIHLLSKRVYAPSIRAMYEVDGPLGVGSGALEKLEKLDKGSIILLVTLDGQGQLRASDLAAIVELDLSTVSRHLTYFEQLGLIVREPDPDDRRASRINITDRGRAGLAAIRAARTALLDSVFASWPPADQAELYRLLDRLQSDLLALPSRSSHPGSHGA